MPTLHSSFVLNGQRYNKKGLLNHCDEILVKTDTPNWYSDIAEFTINWFDLSRHITVQTSGSTGEPKKIKLLKRHMSNSARSTGSFFGIEEGEKALLCLPAKYIAGKMMLVRSFVLGLELTVVEPTSSPLEQLYEKFDFAAMIPLQAENSVAKLDTISKLIIGGGKVSDKQKKLFKDLKKAQVYETYGMTETCTHIAVKPITSDYFCALPGVIINSNEKDCLVIEAPDICSDIIVTNDVVELQDNMRFELLGRLDNIINTGGVKVIPEKIEKEIQDLVPNRFFIAGLPDDKLGQIVVLVVEGENVDANNNLLEAIKRRVEKHHNPKKIITIPSFIETPTGKVRRNLSLYDLV